MVTTALKTLILHFLEQLVFFQNRSSDLIVGRVATILSLISVLESALLVKIPPRYCLLYVLDRIFVLKVDRLIAVHVYDFALAFVKAQSIICRLISCFTQ